VSDAPKSMIRRLEVQLAEKTRDELIEIIARQQQRTIQSTPARLAAAADQHSEVALLKQLGEAYFGAEEMRGLTLPMMARNIERDAQALGYPVREYIKRFTDSGRRRRQS
jgi:DICT domain-containing protein